MTDLGDFGATDSHALSHLKNGESVNGRYAVKYRKPPRQYANGFVFELRISDASGECTVKYWGDRNESAVHSVYDSVREKDVVQIAGMANEYHGAVEISINPDKGGTIRKCTPDEYDAADFVGKSPRSMEGMIHELYGRINAIKDEDVKRLMTTIFNRETGVGERFIRAAASMMYHQNYIGGLMEHALNVAALCEKAADLYPDLDRDLLIAGALLHDIGKIWEFDVTTTIDVSEDGMLLGHIVLGHEYLSGVIDELHRKKPFPETTRKKILHIIISHHGEEEYGSPKKPQLPEAVAIYQADMMDAQLYQYITAKKEANTEDWHWWSRRLGQIYLK